MYSRNRHPTPFDSGAEEGEGGGREAAARNGMRGGCMLLDAALACRCTRLRHRRREVADEEDGLAQRPAHLCASNTPLLAADTLGRGS
eukprot:1260106-Pleurochrysis_carterae.AAC.1